jgi:hypothetical protein
MTTCAEVDRFERILGLPPYQLYLRACAPLVAVRRLSYRFPMRGKRIL